MLTSKHRLPARHAALLSGVLMLSCFAGTAEAEEPDLPDLPRIILELFRPGTPIEQIVAQILQPIRQFDLDDDGLDAADIDTAEAMSMAQYRAGEASRILASDVDGDGAVTEAELREALSYHMEKRENDDNEVAMNNRLQQQIAEVMTRDTDGDKIITLKEMLAVPPNMRGGRDYDFKRDLLKLDQNGDGHLTIEELDSVVRLAFRKVDADGNGIISRQEFSGYEPVIDAAIREVNAPPCALPAAGATDQIALLAMVEADTQPTVTVTGQDTLTTLAHIVIEPGTDPVYLILTSPSGVIWSMEGAVDRLSRVAVIQRRSVSAGWAGAAVQGLAKDRVTFLPRNSCAIDSYTTPESPNGKLIARVVARALGRAPKAMFGVRSAEAVAIPSGGVTKKQKEQDLIISGNSAIMGTADGVLKVIHGALTPLMQEEWLSKSGGVVQVDPKNLIAPGKVETYEVVPGQDGLRLLVENGTLERTDQGYRLLKPLSRWPAGLSGAHAVTFVLPKGMAMPEGNAGQSQIIVEQ